MSSVAVKICFVTFQSGLGLWVFLFVPGKIYSGFVWIIEGEGWEREGVGVEGLWGSRVLS